MFMVLMMMMIMIVMMVMMMMMMMMMVMMMMMMMYFSHYLLCSQAKVVGKLKGLVRVVEDEVCCISSIDAYSTR
jgi:hypothetical protein